MFKIVFFSKLLTSFDVLWCYNPL